MTPTRWAIAAFWVFMVLLGVYYAFNSASQPPPPAPAAAQQPQWTPAPLPGSTPPPRSPNADLRLTHYVAHITPGSPEFSVDVTMENFGSKKATGVEVTVHPYIGNQDTVKSQAGPDEIPGQPGGDPLHNVVQNLAYPDIDPGQTAVQSFTLPMRPDADPCQRDDHPEITFQSAP
jgi:hypothetical protein